MIFCDNNLYVNFVFLFGNITSDVCIFLKKIFDNSLVVKLKKKNCNETTLWKYDSCLIEYHY